MNLCKLLLAVMVCAMCAGQASALEFSCDAPEDYLFGRPTSDDTIYEAENPNVDRSKNTAFIAPGFGTPTSHLPGSGEALTPNLIPGTLSGGLVNAVGSAGANTTGGAAGSSVVPGQYPSVDTSGNFTMTQIPSSPASIAQGSATIGYTEVTDSLYYKGGCLATLKIPSIGVSVKVYQGTDSATLAKGAGHFPHTSIWDGNVCVAAHNRGTNSYFGRIHTLDIGDVIKLTTKLGTRTYAVTSVEKISETDYSLLAPTAGNCITLITCVRGQSACRWAVRAVEIV